MDQVELISLSVGGGLVLLVALVVIFHRPIGGGRSGYVDLSNGDSAAEIDSGGHSGGDGGGD